MNFLKEKKKDAYIYNFFFNCSSLSVEIPELHIGPWQELRLAQFIAARSSSESVKEYYEQWKQLADSIGESEATKRLVWSPLFDSAKSDPLFGLRRAITRGSPQTEKKEIDIKRPFTSHGAFSSLPSKYIFSLLFSLFDPKKET